MNFGYLYSFITIYGVFKAQNAILEIHGKTKNIF